MKRSPRGVPPPDPAAVAAVAAAARAFLEPRWEQVRAAAAAARGESAPPPGPPSRGMCRLSTALLARVLDREIPGAHWGWVGGTPDLDSGVDPRLWSAARPGGMFDPDAGGWRAHYWVEGAAPGLHLLVDVTGDQFGGPPVLVHEGRHPGYRRNWRARIVDHDMDAVRGRASGWFSEWRSLHPEGFAESTRDRDSPPDSPAPRF